MKFRLEQDFEAPVERVLQAKEALAHERHSEIEHEDVIEHVEEQDREFKKKRLSLGDKLPEIVLKMMPREMRYLLQESSYENGGRHHTFRVYAENHEDKFIMSGESRYEENGEGRCKRIYEVSVKANIPLVGGIIENQVGGSYRKNLENDHKLIKNYLEGQQ